MVFTSMESLIGPLILTADKMGLTAVYFGWEDFKLKKFGDREAIETESLGKEDSLHPILQQAKKELEEYFANKRTDFTVPLSIKGTEFQKAVWNQLRAIPFGETRSYQEIASGIQNQKAVRAVGQANKANKLPIIIPCHRVIGKDRSMTGYAGKEIDKKERLLQLEGSLRL